MTQEQDSLKYWNSHPISTDSVPFAAGTPESFEAIYEKWKKTIDAQRLAFVAQCKGRRVLEIGCGIGKDARFLAENGVDYTGVDFSDRSLELAKKHFALHGLKGNFVHADATKLPFADGEFDLVFSAGVLMMVPDMKKACSEAQRVLRPGGVIRIMLYARDSYHYALVRGVVSPGIRALLKFPMFEPILELGPPKLKLMYEICKQHGHSVQRVLESSADTAMPGDGNQPIGTQFTTEKEVRALFPDIEHMKFSQHDLKYFPLPFGREMMKKHFGFFRTMTGEKRGARS